MNIPLTALKHEFEQVTGYTVLSVVRTVHKQFLVVRFVDDYGDEHGVVADIDDEVWHFYNEDGTVLVAISPANITGQR